MCTVADTKLALNHIRRLLKPKGKFLFIEHGWSPDSSVAACQNRLNDTWKFLVGGCHLNRDIGALIQDAGFCRVSYTNLSSGIVAIHSGWRI